MIREVTLRYNGCEKTYSVESDTHYAARVEALGMFLEEFKIPGRPIEFLTRKKGLIEIGVRAAVDRRTLNREGPPPAQFYTEQVDRLRKWIRESNFPEEKKVKATELLLELEKVLSG